MEPPLLLNQARTRARTRCRSFSVQLMEQLATGTRMAVYRVPCKSWNCPSCGPQKANHLSHRATMYFKGHHLRFWTLTIKPQANIPGALLHINKAWNRLRIKITRKYGKVKYLRVLEAQNSTNMPHFHILVDKFISWHWMRGAAVASGFGSHMFVKDVRSDHVIQYVLKYLRKGMKNDDFLEALLSTRGRRFGFSHGCPDSPSISGYIIRYFIKSYDAEAISSLLSLNWWNIAKSSNFYPLIDTPNFAELFFPSSRPLLLAAPSAAATPLASMYQAPPGSLRRSCSPGRDSRKRAFAMCGGIVRERARHLRPPPPGHGASPLKA